jgi:RNA polymerase sigma-70 factor (ECF subfamily)
MVQRVATLLKAAPASRPLDLARLYEQHGDFIRNLLAGLLGPDADPDDMAQEVFLVALRKMRECDVVSPRQWLTRIAVNLAINARRRSRMRKALGFGFGPDLVERRTPEAVTAAREQTRQAYRVLDGLSEKKRTVFILFEILGMTGQEISKALGCSVPTVHSRLFHARSEFLAAFEREEGGSHA